MRLTRGNLFSPECQIAAQPERATRTRALLPSLTRPQKAGTHPASPSRAAGLFFPDKQRVAARVAPHPNVFPQPGGATWETAATVAVDKRGKPPQYANS